MSDTVKSWIEERRNIKESAHLSEVGAALAHEDGLDMFPRALDALQAVLSLCDQWDREVSVPGVPSVECDESFKVRLVIQKAIEGAIND